MCVSGHSLTKGKDTYCVIDYINRMCILVFFLLIIKIEFHAAVGCSIIKPMKNFMIKTTSVLLSLALLFSLCVCGDDAETQAHKQIFAMDNIMTLTAYGKKGDAGVSAAESVINDLGTTLDPQSGDSTVYALDNADGKAVTVP